MRFNPRNSVAATRQPSRNSPSRRETRQAVAKLAKSFGGVGMHFLAETLGEFRYVSDVVSLRQRCGFATFGGIETLR